MSDHWKREEREKKTRADWLEALKVGDRVFVPMNSSSWDGEVGSVSVVERLTKTQIVLQGSNTRYRRDTGAAVGASSGYYYSSRSIQPFTADAQYAMELRSARRSIAKLGDYRVANKLPDSVIFAVANALNAAETEKAVPDAEWLAEQGAYVVFAPKYSRHFVRWADGSEQAGRYGTDVMAVSVAKSAQQMGMTRCGMPLCTDAQHHPCCPTLHKSEADDE